MEIIQTGYFNIWQDQQIWQTKRKKKWLVFGSDNIPIIMFKEMKIAFSSLIPNPWACAILLKAYSLVNLSESFQFLNIL